MSGGILQWNINGFTPQFEYLQLLMNRHNPAIVCLQETNFKDDYVAPLRGYTHYNKNRENYLHASGGVTTYVKNNLPQRLIPLTHYLPKLYSCTFSETKYFNMII